MCNIVTVRSSVYTLAKRVKFLKNEFIYNFYSRFSSEEKEISLIHTHTLPLYFSLYAW